MSLGNLNIREIKMSNENNVLAITDDMGNTVTTNSTGILASGYNTIIGSGTIANSSNCITSSSLIGGSITTYPYYTYPQYNYVTYEIQLRKLENGWVLLKSGKEYILKNPEDVVKYMKENK